MSVNDVQDYNSPISVDRATNTLLDASRFFSSAVTGLALTTDNPLLAVASGLVWGASTVVQRVYDRHGDNKSLRDYFGLTLARDGLSLATGLSLGYGLNKQGRITPENLTLTSLPVFTAGLTHSISRKDLNNLEASLE